jgi:hypothetical protein
MNRVRESRTSGKAGVGPTSDVLTAVEVANWLQIEPRQVARYRIPALRLGRKTIRYLKSDVLAWLETQRSQNGATLV